MKKLLLISLISVFFLQISCGKNSIVGKYRNVDQSKSDIEFTADGRFSLLSEDKPIMSGMYKTDDSKTPKRIDLTLENITNGGSIGSNDKSSPSIGIYKFEGNKLTIKFANGTNANVTYPNDFTDESGFQILQFTFK